MGVPGARKGYSVSFGTSTFIVRLRIMTTISTLEETIMATIVPIAPMRTSIPRARGTYRPRARSPIFAAYPPLTHPMKREGERSAREVKNYCATQMMTIMRTASR